jgi:integrase
MLGRVTALATNKDTVKRVFERYRDEVSLGKKGRRWEQVRIDRFLRTVIWVNKLATRVTSQDLKAWRDKRLTEVQGSSVNRELNLISAIFTYAMKEWDLPLEMNPVKLVKRPPKGKARNRRVAASELEKLWGSTNGKVPRKGYGAVRDYVPWVYEFGIETAMRLGEMCALRWEDVNLEKGYAFVRDSKNGDSRYVPFTPRARELLDKLPRHAELVFPVASESLGATYRKIAKALKIVDLRIHDTRHEGTTRLAKKLRDPLTLASVTGHKDLKSLKVYFNPTPEELVDMLK